MTDEIEAEEFLDFSDRQTCLEELNKLYSAMLAEGQYHYARILVTETFKLFQGEETDPFASLNATLARIAIEKEQEAAKEAIQRAEAETSGGTEDSEGQDLPADAGD